MVKQVLSRRHVLVGGVASATLMAAAGYISFDAYQHASAQDNSSSQGATGQAKTTKVVHSLCNGCSSKCGLSAYVVKGRLTKLIGDAAHPYAQGKLCARGYGYSQIAYSKDRLTDPLKKDQKGRFQKISWDQAYEEIGKKVQEIIGQYGPLALGAVHDPRPSGAYYLKRLMYALGTPNVYTHAAACNLSKESGFTQVIGTGSYESDLINSKMTMFIGRSYADAIRPSSLAQLQQAHEKGAHIVMVDPRCNNSVKFADEWIAINPGTDLALVLAMSNVLVARGTFAKQFVQDQSVGFDKWAAGITGYTPSWAEGITGVDAATIERLATQFAQAAPAASIESGWRGGFGCAYANSGETARAIALFNTLLGCWNQPGGALLVPSISPGKLDTYMFPDVKPPSQKIAGSKEYPLALPSMGTALFAAQLAKEKTMKGMLFYNSNMAAGYSNTAYLKEALSALELMVVIDVQMSETALLADYVLPDTSFLERMELPEFISAKVPAVALRDRVLDLVHPNTRPVDRIISELAKACGVGTYFSFSVADLADAQLRSAGLSLDALRQVGSVSFPEKQFTYGVVPAWKTPTGKIQFTSVACSQAGLSAFPVWVEPLMSPQSQVDKPQADEFRLIGGKQAIHSHTQTANIDDLMQITKDYDLTRVWINEDVAFRLGIADGDKVELSNATHTGQVRVKVTQRLNPKAVFMPSHYGCSSPDEHTAFGVGLRQMDFVPFHLEPGYGSAMTQEALVQIKKVGSK